MCRYMPYVYSYFLNILDSDLMEFFWTFQRSYVSMRELFDVPVRFEDLPVVLNSFFFQRRIINRRWSWLNENE